ncbi:hypothetical protein Godav_023575 [Gossypium davidsonii]|uniref:Uncharacterized protein n=1 Tax=Gossypium davidsonii TaxID=34287 RepID=A0A7J8STQ6_GOSDV|nr:hypothetical protein [Gossypium davidsonii]
MNSEGGLAAVDGPTGRSTKKVRKGLEESLNPVDPIVNDKGIKVASNKPQRASWKDKILGSSSEGERFQADEDIDLLEGDAKKEMLDGIPSVIFSDRVSPIHCKLMDRTAIVKLMGRKISYPTMVNRLFCGGLLLLIASHQK